MIQQFPGRLAAALFLTVTILVTATVHAAGNVEEPEEAVLQFALSGNPDTLDPHRTTGTLTFQTIRSIYDTLVEPDPAGNLVPALATEWEVSADGLIWTFRLREGVRFHNGDEFTSDDVHATMGRLLDPETASPHLPEFEAITEILTPDDRTVTLILSRPVAPLLASLASGWGAILPASLIEAGHDFAGSPVGTGPFVFEEWVRDSRVVMRRNEDYWIQGVPRLDGLVINIIPEDAIQAQGLLSGDLDAIDTVNQQDIPVLEATGEIGVRQDLSSLVMVIAMNTSRPPFNSLEFRQAVSLAINKQAVMDVAYGGGRPVGSFMDVSDPVYEDLTSIYPYDPDRAREALAASGIVLEEPLIMTLPEIFEAHVTAGEMYQEMLERVGIPVQLQLVDWSTWINEVFRGANYDLTVIGHTGKLDPDGRLTGYGTDATYVRWVNRDAAAAIEAARTEVDADRRTGYYREALELMALEVPFVFVGTSYRYLAARENVRGLRQDTRLDTFDFRYVELE